MKPRPIACLMILLTAAAAALGGSPYATHVGQPPDPRTYEYETWVRDLVAARLAEAPIARTTTIYFSQAGDDGTGDGSISTPWKTMAKAQDYHDNTGTSDYALLFKAGEEWAEATGLDITDEDVTVGSYGTGVRPLLHCFTNTIASGGAAWTNATGDRWTTATAQVGWIRDIDRRLEPYAALASTGAVESNPRSWYWDGATLHINAGSGVDPNDIDYEWTGNVADDGVNIAGDGGRVHNLRADGWGCAEGTGHQNYGVTASPTGTDAVVLTDIEGYYSGRHAAGSQYTSGGAGGIVTVVNVTAGYVNRTLSTANIYNAYSASGAHEYVMVNAVARFGYLPDTTAPAGGADANGIDAFYGHTSAADADLVLVEGLTCTAEPDLVNATWADGRLCFATDNAPDAADITDARVIFRGVRSTHGQAGKGHFRVPADSVYLDCLWELTLNSASSTLEPSNAFNLDGWAVNCVWRFTDTLVSRRMFLYNQSPNTGELINCLIETNGPAGVSTQVWEFIATEGNADGVRLTNTAIINTGPRAFETNLLNSATTLKHIATYNVDQSGADGVDQALNQVVLDCPPPDVRSNPRGFVTPDSPLYRVGLPGVASRVEFDIHGRPRDPVAPSIGPVEHAYQSSAAAAMIAHLDTVAVNGVNINQVSGDAAAANNLEAVLDGTGATLTLSNTLTVDVLSVSGDAAAADNLEAVLDGTGAPIKLMATQVGGAALTVENSLTGGHGILITHTGIGGAGLTVTSGGTGGTAVLLNDDSDVGVGGMSDLTGLADAAALGILTTPANTLTTDASGYVELPATDGITAAKLRELELSDLLGTTTVIDNGDGTKTLRFFKQDGTTPLRDVDYNTTTGEHPATEIDPAP